MKTKWLQLEELIDCDDVDYYEVSLSSEHLPQARRTLEFEVDAPYFTFQYDTYDEAIKAYRALLRFFEVLELSQKRESNILQQSKTV